MLKDLRYLSDSNDSLMIYSSVLLHSRLLCSSVQLNLHSNTDSSRRRICIESKTHHKQRTCRQNIQVAITIKLLLLQYELHSRNRNSSKRNSSIRKISASLTCIAVQVIIFIYVAIGYSRYIKTTVIILICFTILKDLKSVK